MLENKPKNGLNPIISFISVLLTILLAGTTVYFWQESVKQRELGYLKQEMMQKDSNNNMTEEVEAENKAIKELSPSYSEPATEPVIVYSPSGLFTDAEKTEINNKLIKPFIDWNAENEMYAVSITVEKPTPAIEGYKYSVSYVNEGGGNGGFLFGTKEPLEWWMPECMGGCKFSPYFTETYPEIVSQYE